MIAMVESATPERRDVLLNSLQLENPALAAFIRTKVLTLGKVMNWPLESLHALLLELEPKELEAFRTVVSINAVWVSQFESAMSSAGFHLPPLDLSTASQRVDREVLEVAIMARIRDLHRVGRIGPLPQSADLHLDARGPSKAA